MEWRTSQEGGRPAEDLWGMLAALRVGGRWQEKGAEGSRGVGFGGERVSFYVRTMMCHSESRVSGKRLNLDAIFSAFKK